MQEFANGLKKNFKINYQRMASSMGLPAYDTVFTDDFIRNYQSLTMMFKQNERNFTHRAAGYFRGMIVIVSKINDIEQPGWGDIGVSDGIYGAKSQIIEQNRK